MCRIAIFISVLVMNLGSLSAQTLTGKVCDIETKEPISNAVVYLNGTSLYAATDATGTFKLVVKDAMNTSLVVTHVAYNEVSVPDPFTSIPEVIYLKETDMVLEEVNVVAKGDPFTREQKLKAFREHFLGATQAGDQCLILNEEDVKLFYNVEEKMLTAKSEKPLEIANPYLGYKVTFKLSEFSVSYASKSLASKEVIVSKYMGLSFFMDEAPEDKEILKRRERCYASSTNAFFKGVVDESLGKTKFRLSFGGAPINPKACFTVVHNPSRTGVMTSQITVTPKMYKSPSANEYGIPLFGPLTVVYGNEEDTQIAFLSSTFNVDMYGNVDKVDKIMFVGEMGRKKLGYLLPADYVPVSAARKSSR